MHDKSLCNYNNILHAQLGSILFTIFQQFSKVIQLCVIPVLTENENTL